MKLFATLLFLLSTTYALSQRFTDYRLFVPDSIEQVADTSNVENWDWVNRNKIKVKVYRDEKTLHLYLATKCDRYIVELKFKPGQRRSIAFFDGDLTIIK